MSLIAEEKIISILESAGAEHEEIQKVIKVLRLWRKGELTAEDVFLFIMGLAREKLIPLGPKHVGDIREALGLPRASRPFK